MLDDRAYDAVRRDPGATRQALILVVLVTVVNGVNRLDDPVVWQIISPFLSVLYWTVEAWLVFLIGTRLLGASAPDGDWVQLLRLSGFAQVTTVLSVLEPVEVIGPVLSYASLLWWLVLAVKAVKLVLAVRTGRAIATGFLAEIPTIALLGAVYVTFRHWGLA
jgi:hypothetical protein